MMTREQIESIAKRYGIEVTYTEPGNGGFIIDESGKINKSINNIFMKNFGLLDDEQKTYDFNDENAFLAA